MINLKKFFLPVVLLLAPGIIQADTGPGEPGDFGLGLMVGAPTGLTGKFWLSPQSAIDGGLAWHFGDEDRFQIHGDYLWHFNSRYFALEGTSIPLYFGGGMRVLTGDESTGAFRVPFGIAFLLQDVPLEFFGEIVPVVRFAPSTGGELDGGIGVRYYFKR